MNRPRWWPAGAFLAPGAAITENLAAAERTPAPPMRRCLRCTGMGRVACVGCGAVFAPSGLSAEPEVFYLVREQVPLEPVIPLRDVLREARRKAIANALRVYDGHAGMAAQALGISANLVVHWRP